MISLVETVLLNEHGALWSDFSSNLSAWLGFEFHGPSMKVRMVLALQLYFLLTIAYISFLMLDKRRRALGTTRIDSAEHESRPSNKRGRRGQKGKGPPCDQVRGLK